MDAGRLSALGLRWIALRHQVVTMVRHGRGWARKLAFVALFASFIFSAFQFNDHREQSIRGMLLWLACATVLLIAGRYPKAHAIPDERSPTAVDLWKSAIITAGFVSVAVGFGMWVWVDGFRGGDASLAWMGTIGLVVIVPCVAWFVALFVAALMKASGRDNAYTRAFSRNFSWLGRVLRVSSGGDTPRG